MEKITVDDRKAFDFGKTSKAYAKYRDIYPEEVFEKLHEIGVGVQGSRWLDLGTGTGVIPRGLAKYGTDIVATDISEQQITEVIALSKDYSNIKYEVLAAEDISYPEHSLMRSTERCLKRNILRDLPSGIRYSLRGITCK